MRHFTRVSNVPVLMDHNSEKVLKRMVSRSVCGATWHFWCYLCPWWIDLIWLHFKCQLREWDVTLLNTENVFLFYFVSVLSHAFTFHFSPLPFCRNWGHSLSLCLWISWHGHSYKRDLIQTRLESSLWIQKKKTVSLRYASGSETVGHLWSMCSDRREGKGQCMAIKWGQYRRIKEKTNQRERLNLQL